MKKDPLKISGMHDGATPSVYRNAANLRNNMTEPECKLWDYLKSRPAGFKFRRQHPIAGYVLDFYCHKLRLSIEVDGNYHLKKVEKEKDKERTIYFNNVGITEIRFYNQQVIEKFDKVVKIIENELIKASLQG